MKKKQKKNTFKFKQKAFKRQRMGQYQTNVHRICQAFKFRESRKVVNKFNRVYSNNPS